MKPIPSELHIMWADGVTVEVRKFPSLRATMRYVNNNIDKKSVPYVIFPQDLC